MIDFHTKTLDELEEIKGLTPSYYPDKYKNYIKEERDLLTDKVRGAGRGLEAGIGTGRLVSDLAPLVKEFIGVDNAEFMLEKSRKESTRFDNVKVVDESLENLNKVFSDKYFDVSLCVWNTLGNVKDDEIVLRQLLDITSGSIFVTVFEKGHMKDRLEFYRAIGVSLKDVDEDNETFYSEDGLESRTYSREDVLKLAEKVDLEVREFKTLGGVILWAELVRKH